MKKYNKLTECLLAEGYTKEHHPDYVKEWNDFYGGFEYKVFYRDKLVYETPCGLHCKGSTAMGGMSYKGVDWSHENDCPTIVCPKWCKGCEQNHEYFRDRDCCVVHPVDREWRYEGSVEEQQKASEDERERLKQKFIQDHNGRVCVHHMRFDKYTREWSFHYDPAMICARGYCGPCNSQFADGQLCPVLGKPITKEKGNVYYDVRFEGRDYTKDGTIFEGARFVQIIKGVPLYSKPIPLEIAKVIAKTGRKNIEWKVRYNTRWYPSVWLYEAEIGKRDLNWNVENIRAEKKAVRDFDQDLKDIEEGILVTHELDEQKKRKEEKAERRQASRDKRIEALERKILKAGWDAMDERDKHVAIKKIGWPKIMKLDIQSKRARQEKEKEPEQMSVFDFLETGKEGTR